jgi:curved DNA-binding protein CbpA
MNVNPYQLLNVNKNYTINELRTNFKDLAFKYHPDKGGSEELFNTLIYCYKKLYKDLKAKENDKQFHQLKNEFKNNTPSSYVYHKNEEDFNHKFNKLFDENRMKDPIIDKGYTEEMVDKMMKSKNKDLVKYVEPKAYQLQKSLNYIELGCDTMDDYSGLNEGKNLHYTDYLKAHTTTEIINPKNVKEREAYKNLDDIKIKREKADFTLTDEEKYYYEQLKNEEELNEMNRMEKLNKLDNMWGEHYNKVNKLLLKN